ncbi:MAG: repeat protein [Gemmataceae bacterium]|nr:repeat protein [Gemmataceae bacterium]
MRTAAGWAVIGILGAGVLTAGAFQKVVVAAAPPAAQPTVAAGPIDPTVADLVTALGDPDYRTREKAGQALEAKGDKILPDLRRAMTDADNPEVARRLAVLVRRMDHDRLVAPKRVTLAVKNKSAKDVFDEIAKQSGYRIEFQGNPAADQKYSFEFDKVPFWQVVDKVAEKTGTTATTEYDDEAIRVNAFSESANPYVAYAGPFRFMANSISSNRNVQLSGLNRGGIGNRSNESVHINFTIQSEPKNPILGTTNHMAEVLAAADETGASMVPPKDQNNGYRAGYYNGSYQRHNVNGNINLVRGARDATTIKTLKAKMGIILLAGTVPEVVILDPLKTKNKKIVGRTVEIDFDSLAEQNGQYTATLTAKKVGADDQNGIDYNWSNNLWQKLELVDEKGNRYRANWGNVNNNGMAVHMTVPFAANDRRGQPQKLGPPVKLIFNEWLQVTHEVTFEFKDVPLP